MRRCLALLAAAGDGGPLVNGGISAVVGGRVLHADRRLVLAQQQAVHKFHALHQAVVGVRHFVLPHAEATAAEDVVMLEIRNRLRQNPVSFDARRGVAVLGVEYPRVHDVLLIFFLDHAGIDKPADHLIDDRLAVHRLELAVADLAQERVMRVLVRRHVRRVIRQIRDAIERAIVFGEIHPRLGARRRLLNADADHVSAGVAK